MKKMVILRNVSYILSLLDFRPIFNIGVIYAYINYFILTEVRQATAFLWGRGAVFLFLLSIVSEVLTKVLF